MPAQRGFRIIGPDGTEAEVDSLGYLVEIMESHHKIHEGKHFTVADYATVGAAKYWHVIAPDSTVRVHLLASMSASAGGLAEMYENPTTTDNGAALTRFNNDRNSSTTANLLVYKDPTIGADGTLLEARRIGGGSGPFRIGGDVVQRVEFILKQAEQYLFKFTPDGAGTVITFTIAWYEA